jgi:hypothetical protein
MESLEQLRVFWYGEKIHVSTTDSVQGFGTGKAQNPGRWQPEIVPEDSTGYVVLSERESPTDAAIIGFNLDQLSQQLDV